MLAPWSWSWWLSSFDVLDLFANAFQFGLHLYHMTGDFRIIGFRADRIDLPVRFPGAGNRVSCPQSLVRLSVCSNCIICESNLTISSVMSPRSAYTANS